MKVAVVGCAHGELDKIYDSIRHVEENENIRVDFVICCGDFQSVRNYDDLNCMAVPPAYRQLNTFYRYYAGECKAPYLTLFVGGNHEASNYLAELPYGGWVAPEIYYLGFANVVQIGGLRIGGLSGIYKGQHYLQGHFECPPYNEDTKRSAYHVRQLEVFRLKQLKPESLDIFVSHDWPRGIHAFGDAEQLFRVKPYFRDEAMRGELGNPSTEDLLRLLKPKYWFSAHMHVKFPALVEHENGTQTKFLALDKCLPRRHYVQILDVGDPVTERPTGLDLKYDLEWLTVLKSTNHLCSTSNRIHYMPGPTPGAEIRYQFTPTETEMNEVADLFQHDFIVPQNFKWTAPPVLDPNSRGNRQRFYVNPQTSEFCTKLGVSNINELLAKLRPMAVEQPYYLQCEMEGNSGMGIASAGESGKIGDDTMWKDESENPDEIQLDEEGDECCVDEDRKEETICSEEQPVSSEMGSTVKRSHEDAQPQNETNQGTYSETGTGSASESNVLKRFKRRNADLYATSEADEND